MFLTPCLYSISNNFLVSSISAAPSSTPGTMWQCISNIPSSSILVIPSVNKTAGYSASSFPSGSLCYSTQLFLLSVVVCYYSSVASSAGASRAFMLRLIFLSSPLKSTTLASISCPIDSTSAGLATCSLEIWDT